MSGEKEVHPEITIRRKYTEQDIIDLTGESMEKELKRVDEPTFPRLELDGHFEEEDCPVTMNWTIRGEDPQVMLRQNKSLMKGVLKMIEEEFPSEDEEGEEEGDT